MTKVWQQLRYMVTEFYKKGKDTVMERMNRKTYIAALVVISAAAMALRWIGIHFVGVDYEVCLSAWYEQLKTSGSLRGLAEFQGDYNMPYVTVLYFLTYLPVEPIIAIKMVSILFDYLGAFVLKAMLMEAAPQEKKYAYGVLAYGMVLLCPVVVINSAWLAQSESIWVSLALLAFWYIRRDKPVKGMLIVGCALGMKLQAIFILPIILIYYFGRKKFSILHLLWIPAAIELLCIPAIIGGCGWDIAYKVFRRMLGQYPHMYYYYPNVWTYFQEAPYYVFGKAAIMLTFAVLLLFAILYVRSGREHTPGDYMVYVSWTAMTCAMLLPCMHERYNYLAEVVLLVCAVIKPKLRIPAVLLLAASVQCYGQSYLNMPRITPYALALCNIGVYLYLTKVCLGGLYRCSVKREMERMWKKCGA